jgi:Transcriptional regulator
MDVTSALRAFVRTVERGSVTAAARDLALSQPAVSKQIANLEERVGARLLERSARIVRPTAEGLTLYEKSRAALAALDAALEGVRAGAGALEGTIRVHAPSCVGTRYVHPIVMAFQRAHPAVTVELVLENRSIDLVYENFDLALRYERPEAADVIIRRIGLVRRILAASPAFLARFGPVDDLATLATCPLVVTPRVMSGRSILHLVRDGEAVDVEVSPILRTNDAQVLLRTLVDGHAAGPVQTLLVREELLDGRLVRLLPDHEVRASDAYIAYPSLRSMRPAVRAFIDAVVAGLSRVDGFFGPEAADRPPPDAPA